MIASKISFFLVVYLLALSSYAVYNSSMPKLADQLAGVTMIDKDFIGTIAFRDEKLTLPDGSKMALGLDDGHWVLVYQERSGSSFKVYEYDQHHDKLMIDKKPGSAEEFKTFKKLVKSFYQGAEVADLVTILPPGGQ